MGDIGGFDVMSNMGSSVQKGNRFGSGRVSIFENEEEGVLLQPDFEFDEEGNIIELAVRKRPQDNSRVVQAASRNSSEAPVMKVREEAEEGFLFDQAQVRTT